MVNPDPPTTPTAYPFVRKLIYQSPSSAEEVTSFFHTLKKCPPQSSKSDLAGEEGLQVSTETSLRAFHAFVNKTISDFQLHSIPKLVNHQQSKRTNSIINIILNSPSSVTVSVDSFCEEGEDSSTEVTQPNGFRENPQLPIAKCDASNKSSTMFLPKTENESFGLANIKGELVSASSTFVQAREKANRAAKKLIESVLAVPGHTERAINDRIQASKRAVNNRIQMKVAAVNRKVDETISLMHHRIEVARLRVIAFPNRLLTAAALELKAARGRFVHFIYITPVDAMNRKLDEGKRRVNHAIELRKTMILDAKDKRKKAITDRIQASKTAVYEGIGNRKRAVEERISGEIQAIRKSLKEAVSLANIFKKKSHAECQSPTASHSVPTRRLLHDFEHEKTLHVFEVNRKPSLCYELDQVFDSIKQQMSTEHIGKKLYGRERYSEALSPSTFVLNRKNGAAGFSKNDTEMSGFQEAYQRSCRKSTTSEQVKIPTRDNVIPIRRNLNYTNHAKEMNVRLEEATTNKSGGGQSRLFNSRRSSCRYIQNIPDRFYTDPKLTALETVPKNSKTPNGTSSSPELEIRPYPECHPKSSLQTRNASDSGISELRKRPKESVSSSRNQTRGAWKVLGGKAKVQVRKKKESLGVLKIVKHVLKKSMMDLIALARNTVMASNQKRSGVEKKKKNRPLLGYLKLLLQDLSSCVVNGLRCLTQTSSNFLEMIVCDQPESCQ